MAVAIEELHEVVNYRGRDICSCGDFNCASLDKPRQPKIYFNGELRNAVANAYSGHGWKQKVKQMSDAQVYVLFQKFKSQDKI